VNELWIARHGETEWSRARRHTSITDLGLTAEGVRQAHSLGERLRGAPFALVLSSPSTRARRTAELAGFAKGLELEEDLAEYRYGDYEGRTTAEIRAARPGWELWRDGCPGGETTADVAVRADRLLSRLERVDGNVLVFGHGHMSRVLAARRLGLDARAARLLTLATATLSIVGLEHGRPAIALWNAPPRAPGRGAP
jgi:broad specificity phosphatase PhoE